MIWLLEFSTGVDYPYNYVYAWEMTLLTWLVIEHKQVIIKTLIFWERLRQEGNVWLSNVKCDILISFILAYFMICCVDQMQVVLWCVKVCVMYWYYSWYTFLLDAGMFQVVWSVGWQTFVISFCLFFPRVKVVSFIFCLYYV